MKKNSNTLLIVAFFGLLLLMIYKIYKYITQSFSSDLANDAVQSAQQYTVVDWIKSVLGLSATQTADGSKSSTNVWDMLIAWIGKKSNNNVVTNDSSTPYTV